jgi:hypothetical protein
MKWSLGERFRRAKHDGARKASDTSPGANEVLGAATPRTPRPRLQSTPLTNHILYLQDLDAYNDRPVSWVGGQATCDTDSRLSWEPISFSCPIRQSTRCTSNHSQNGEVSSQSSTGHFLSRLDEALAPPSPPYPPLSQIQEQLPKRSSADTFYSASLITSVPSASATPAVRKKYNHRNPAQIQSHF